MHEFHTLIEAVKRGALQETRAIIAEHPDFIHRHDESGATALHYAAFGGYRALVELLVQQGADINARDGQFGATPAGWAIEYMREMGGFLGTELTDFAFAIRQGDAEWAGRFLKRFPALCHATDEHGTPFKVLAKESGNAAIAHLFELEAAN